MAQAPLYQTAAYSVRLFNKTDGHMPDELRQSYGVFHTVHAVLFASTQSLGHAISACQELQSYLDEVLARDLQPASPARKGH